MNDNYPRLTEIEHFKDVRYKVKTHGKVYVGNTYTIACPMCGREFLFTAQQSSNGVNEVKCCTDGCMARFFLKVKEEPKEEQSSGGNTVMVGLMKDNSLLKHRGQLEWRKNILQKNKAELKPGANTVGRNDPMELSDINIDDNTVSRRSLLIEVERDDNQSGYRYRLTVVKATNPVTVNSKRLEPGNCIYLNFGDTIKVGNTTLTLKKD